MKTIIVLFTAALLAGCGKSEYQRLYDEGRAKMLTEITNEVVGIQKLIQVNYDPYSTNKFEGSQWNSVTVDYLNKVGGMERTNVLFAFSYLINDGKKEIYCHADVHYYAEVDHARYLRETHQTEEEFQRSLKSYDVNIHK